MGDAQQVGLPKRDRPDVSDGASSPVGSSSDDGIPLKSTSGHSSATGVTPSAPIPMKSRRNKPTDPTVAIKSQGTDRHSPPEEDSQPEIPRQKSLGSHLLRLSVQNKSECPWLEP